MKRIYLLSIALLLVCNVGFAQKTLKAVIEELAHQQNREISFSPNLVELDKSIDFELSPQPDSCLILLEKQANIRIKKTETHFIVLPASPQKIALQGKVVNAQTGELLPFAHLLIPKAGTGTITNKEGWFSFKVNGKIAGEEVIFSFLGYENKRVRIPFENADSMVVEMKPKPYSLSDVYVLPNGNTAVDIVKRAVKNIKRNYHRKTIQYNAFYRNTNFRDTVASQLIEAAVLIEDKGIARPSETTKIQLQEIRKSNNYLVPGNKRVQKAFDKMWGHRNIIHRAVGNNPVRQYRNDWWYKPLTDYETFKYEFEGFEWLDSVKVYKIKYIYDALWPNGKRASESKNSIDYGFIYINANDYGILKFSKYWKLLNKSKNSLRHPKDMISRHEISYQKVNGKYYLKYYNALTIPNGAFYVYENPNAPRKQRKIKEAQWAEAMLLVTKITTERKDFDRIRYREKLKREENTYELKYPYNPDFWKTYDPLAKNPVEEKIMNEIEWEKDLSVQFEENAENDDEDN